jgi:hypothetical protein
LRHDFSALKYDDKLEPDFKGYPDEIAESYVEDVLDYSKTRLSLVLDRDHNVTKDRVNFKDSLKTVEVAAIRRLLSTSTLKVDGAEISEKAEITLQNYQKMPFYE